jgi:hypothetical protein
MVGTGLAGLIQLVIPHRKGTTCIDGMVAKAT